MADIHLNEEQLKVVASAAILEHIGEEERLSLVKQALEYLMTPQRDRGSYGLSQTPLQEAFNNAIRQVVGDVVRAEMSQNREVPEKLRVLIGEAFERAFTGNGREALVEAMTATISRVLSPER